MNAGHVRTVAQEAGPLLMTPREAAQLLRVSAGFLRASSCPKILITGNGNTTKSVVRYQRSEILKWIHGQSVETHHRQHRKS